MATIPELLEQLKTATAQQAQDLLQKSEALETANVEVNRLKLELEAAGGATGGSTGGGGAPGARPTVSSWAIVTTPRVTIAMTFSKPIALASLSAKDLVLTSGAGGSKTTNSLGVQLNSAATVATFDFGVISAGNYTATMPSTGITDQAGQSMATAASRLFQVAAGGGGTTPPPDTSSWPTKPAVPNMPSTGPTIATHSKVISGTTDFAGATYQQIDGPGRLPLFDIKADNVTLSGVRAFAKDGYAGGIDTGAKGFVCEDVDWLDNSGWCFTIRGAGRGFVCRRQRSRTIARYFAFVEAKDTLWEDIACFDYGADGIPGTADDDGASDYESFFRSGGGGGTCRRIVCDYGPKHFSVKACFRGDGDWIMEDIHARGGISGFNPLGAGDGGMGELLDRAGQYKFSNPDDVRRGVRAFAKANPNATPMDFARYVRSVARVWNDPTSAATQAAKGDRAFTFATDAQLQGWLDSRKEQLSHRASSVWRRSLNEYGYGIEAGSVTTFEATNIIRGAERNGGCPFSGKVGEYPAGPKISAGVETDPGWRFPFDVVRPVPRVICKGSADGKEWPRFYGDALVWTLTLEQAKTFFSGKFFLNDVLIDTGRPAA